MIFINLNLNKWIWAREALAGSWEVPRVVVVVSILKRQPPIAAWFVGRANGHENWPPTQWWRQESLWWWKTNQATDIWYHRRFIMARPNKNGRRAAGQVALVVVGRSASRPTQLVVLLPNEYQQTAVFTVKRMDGCQMKTRKDHQRGFGHEKFAKSIICIVGSLHLNNNNIRSNISVA